jgi:hypothetical protein
LPNGLVSLDLPRDTSVQATLSVPHNRYDQHFRNGWKKQRKTIKARRRRILTSATGRWLKAEVPDFVDDHLASAAAVRVRCCWRDRIDDFLDRLKRLANDDHPRVRLRVLLDAIRSLDAEEESQAASVVFDLARLLIAYVAARGDRRSPW